ncbi:MAG TPA: protein kinase [Gemmataceae bacterium]|nr:protein kinase [Gemmataceae bacterium]
MTADADRPAGATPTAASAITSASGDGSPASSGPVIPPPTAPALPTVRGYEIKEELGKGGMGVVYRAWQAGLNRTVALKMILAGPLADEHEVERFRREAEAVAAMQHPHIVQIHEVGEADGRPYLALEFCGGGALSRKLAAGPLPADEAAALAETLARTVHAVHLRKIIHRDLKPANILLGDGGEPKITDFGLAKKLDADGRTPTEAILGTPSYMAPEQAKQGGAPEVGPAADIYALGAILYECLTGRPPFKAATIVDTLLQVVHDDPAPPRHLQSRTPRDLDTICLKCLQKDPRRRYATAEALADDLGRFRRREPITARPIGPLGRAVKWARRRPAVAGLLAALAAVIGVASAAGAWELRSYLREKEDKEQYALQLAASNGKLAEEQGARLKAQEAAANRQQEVIRALGDRAKAEEAAKAEAQQRVEERGRHNDELEDRLYLNRVSLAYREWTANRTDESERLLSLGVPGFWQKDRRNWEWRYLHRLTTSGWLDLDGHTAFVPCVAWSRDGRKMASGDADGKVKVWAWLDDRLAFPMDLNGRHTGEVQSVAFSPDGRFLASASGSGVGTIDRPFVRGDVMNWDLQKLRDGQPRTLPGGQAGAVAWSPDGKRLASGGSGVVELSDPETGKSLKTLGEKLGAVRGLAYSPDGKHLAAVADRADNALAGELRVWEVESGKEQFAQPAHGLGALGVAWSADGKRIATCGGDQCAAVWDAETGRRLQTLWGHTAVVHAVAFSPDGREIATAGVDGLVKIWDAELGREEGTLRRVGAGPIWSLAYRPDGARLACSGMDWSIHVCDPRRAPDYSEAYGDVYYMAVSPDGRRLASFGQYAADGVMVWGLRTDPTFSTVTAQERFEFKGQTGVVCAAFSPDGRRLASASDEIDVDAPPKPGQPFDLPRVGVIKVWDSVAGKEQLTIRGQKGAIHALAFSLDGRLLASGGEDGAVKVWDADTGRERLTFTRHTGPVATLAFRPDGLLASAAKEVILWDPKTGEVRRTFHGNPSAVTGVAFSPDGSRLVAAGSAGEFGRQTGAVKVWDADTGAELRTLTGHNGPVNAVAFSPDGSRMATAGGDRAVKVWDAGTGQEILTLGGADAGLRNFVAFTPDGLLVAGGPEGLLPGRITIWDGRPPNAPPLQTPPAAEETAAARAELDKLQGAWEFVSVEDDGRKPPAEQLHGRTLTIDGDRLRFQSGGRVVSEYAVRIDPSWLPKEIALTAQKKTVLGVYRLEGDELKVCLNKAPDQERPQALGAPEGSGRVAFVFKRMKP